MTLRKTLTDLRKTALQQDDVDAITDALQETIRWQEAAETELLSVFEHLVAPTQNLGLAPAYHTPTSPIDVLEIVDDPDEHLLRLIKSCSDLADSAIALRKRLTAVAVLRGAAQKDIAARLGIPTPTVGGWMRQVEKEIDLPPAPDIG